MCQVVAVFFWVLEAAVVNSLIIYEELLQERDERSVAHISFRRKMIKDLSDLIRNSVVPRARTGPRMLLNISDQWHTTLRMGG